MAEYADASINRYLEALPRAYTIGREERVPPLVRLKLKIEMLDESSNVREGFLSREQYEALPVKLKWEQVDWHRQNRFASSPPGSTVYPHGWSAASPEWRSCSA